MKRIKVSTMARQEFAYDELIEIFIRLPVKSVLRFKSLSKRHHSLILDPIFIRAYIKRHTNHPDDHHVLVYTGPGSNPDTSDGKLTHYTTRLHDLTSDGKLTHYTTRSHDSSPNFNTYNLQFEVLQSSHGLLLCGTHSTLNKSHFNSYYVCNFQTKQQVQLPCLQSGAVLCIGFMCEPIDPCLNQVEFTVIIGHEVVGFDYFFVNVFFSKRGCWIAYQVNCSFMPCRADFKISDAIVYKGIFHWCEPGKCIATYDPRNTPSKCNAISLPRKAGNSTFYLCDRVYLVEEKIRVVVFDWGRFSVWELDDYGEGRWCNKYVSTLDMWKVDVAFLSPVDGEIAWLKNVREQKFRVFNMKTCLYEELTIPCPNGAKVMPFAATSWPAVVPPLLSGQKT